MGLLRLGLLEKSQPNKKSGEGLSAGITLADVESASAGFLSAANDGCGGHQLFQQSQRNLAGH